MYNFEKTFRTDISNSEKEIRGKILDSEIEKNRERVEKDFMDNFEAMDNDLEKVALSAVEKINKFFTENNIDIEKQDLSNFNIFTVEADENPYFDNTKDIIVISKYLLQSRTDKEIEAILIHEMYHSISIDKLSMMLKDKEKLKFLIRNKNGYQKVIEEYDNKNHKIISYFSDFNEGVTDTLTYETLKSDRFVNYKEEILLVKQIIEKVYSKKGEISKFLNGYFKGNIMHLRSIEKEYGEGSLRLLASIQTESLLENRFSSDEELKNKQLYFRKLSIDFFMEDDLDKREDIKKKMKDFFQ